MIEYFSVSRPLKDNINSINMENYVLVHLPLVTSDKWLNFFILSSDYEVNFRLANLCQIVSMSLSP